MIINETWPLKTISYGTRLHEKFKSQVNFYSNCHVQRGTWQAKFEILPFKRRFNFKVLLKLKIGTRIILISESSVSVQLHKLNFRLNYRWSFRRNPRQNFRLNTNLDFRWSFSFQPPGDILGEISGETPIEI